MTLLHAPFAAPDVQELPVAVWVGKAPDGEFLYANPAFFELFGVSASGGAALRLPLARALEQRATVTVDDLVLHRVDGSKANLCAVARPIFCDRGSVTHVIVALWDMTPALEGQGRRDRRDGGAAASIE